MLLPNIAKAAFIAHELGHYKFPVTVEGNLYWYSLMTSILVNLQLNYGFSVDP